MATNNRKQSLINQVNRFKEQIAQKEGAIAKIKAKPSGGNNSSKPTLDVVFFETIS